MKGENSGGGIPATLERNGQDSPPFILGDITMNTKIKIFNKNDIITRKWTDIYMGWMSYYPVKEEEVKERSLLKTGVLGLIFLPLALAGHTTRVKVTYEKKEVVNSKKEDLPFTLS